MHYKGVILRKANIITSCIIILISIFFLFATSDINKAAGTILGPRFFPILILSVIIFLSLIIVILNIINRKKIDEVFIKKDELLRITVTVLMFIVYILIIEKIGFIISTALFMIVMSVFYYGKIDKKFISISGISVIMPVFLYLLFSKMFHVLLP